MSEQEKSGALTRLRQSRIVSTFATPVLAGLVLTVLAPLGTHVFSVGIRALYWIGLCLAGGLGAMAVQTGLRRSVPEAGTLTRIVLQSLGSTVAVAPFVVFGTRSTTALGLLMTLFYIAVIAVVITSVAELAARKPVARNSPVDDGSSPQRAALMERLPLRFRDADLYGVASDDHYVRVHTSAGEHMLLMRLADVADLARPVDGLSPHRSWWVAEQGVERAGRTNGRTVLRLKDGTDVPVSRAGASRVRAAGWLR